MTNLLLVIIVAILLWPLWVLLSKKTTALQKTRSALTVLNVLTIVFVFGSVLANTFFQSAPTEADMLVIFCVLLILSTLISYVRITTIRVVMVVVDVIFTLYFLAALLFLFDNGIITWSFAPSTVATLVLVLNAMFLYRFKTV